jgi:hypothetical protein
MEKYCGFCKKELKEGSLFVWSIEINKLLNKRWIYFYRDRK